VASSTETGREADAAPDAGRVILETTDADNGKEGAACEVLPSGIRLLHVDDTSPAGGATAGNIELLHNMGDVIDYLLVDLPFRPTPFARFVLFVRNLEASGAFRYADIDWIKKAPGVSGSSGLDTGVSFLVVIGK
jgi:hypothetical protein